MTDPVLLTIEDQIAVITLNRPERRNALNQALLKGLYEHLEKVSNDDSVRAVIITGEGKSFCAGLDLDALKEENLFDPKGDGTDLPDVFKACDKPIIGAVNGHAITGGFEIALNCDFLIASEAASFADTHARVGIHPGWGLTQLLQQAVGKRRARQMSFTCRFITAQTACNWGLVNEVVPNESLMRRTMEIAGDICQTGPDMLKVVKELIDYRDHANLEDAYAHERAEFAGFIRNHFSG